MPTKRKVSLKYYRSLDKIAVSTVFACVAGGILGFLLPLNILVHKKCEKKFGYNSFPTERPEDITAPFENENSLAHIPDCQTVAPKSCTSSIECQKSCGPSYRCQTVHVETIVNGLSLNVGEKYCLPEAYENTRCKCGTSILNITIDPIDSKPRYTCSCIYPDIFTGVACDELVACRNTLDPEVRAPLLDRTTGKEVDLNDPFFLRSVDLYEKLQDGSPRFFCSCKSVDPLLTSAIDPMRCLKDPCLELVQFGRTVHKTVTGWSDGEKDNTVLNCGCGDPRVTRLYGGAENPCLPVMDPHCGEIEFSEKYDGLRCMCGPNKIFVPCRNKYRSGATDLLECGTDGNYMVRPDAPEAGACVNVCERCDALVAKQHENPAHPGFKITSACQDDVRTLGRCITNKAFPKQPLVPGFKQPMFQCACEAQPLAEFWQVEENDAPGTCRGRKPPCKQLLGSCNPNIDFGWQGRECCHCPLSCGNLMGSNVCIVDFESCV